MGQYKVPQNVEAEDTILGPLTMRQFIYVVIGLAWGAVTFAIFRRVPLFFVAFGLPISFLFLLLGVYRRQDQPFEQLFVALVNFWAKPRRRLWEKEPIAEIFTIEPEPPKAEPISRNAEEVRGQLEKIVRIMESQGGGAKRPEIQEPVQQAKLEATDRLFLPEHFKEGNVKTDTADVTRGDDVLDVENNPKAHKINQLVEGAVQKVRDEAIAKMQAARSVNPGVKETPPPNRPSTSVMTENAPDAMLKQTLANSQDMRVDQIADILKNKTASVDRGQLKEGETLKVENSSRTE